MTEPTLRLVLNLTPDEAADLASSLVVLRERRVERAESIELDEATTPRHAVAAQRAAERARSLAAKVGRALDSARRSG